MAKNYYEMTEQEKKQARALMMDRIDGILETADRPRILPKPLPVYEHNFSEYPEMIRVSFSDGSTAVYELRTDQPHPVIIENIKIIRKWKKGYVNQPEIRRRRK